MTAAGTLGAPGIGAGSGMVSNDVKGHVIIKGGEVMATGSVGDGFMTTSNSGSAGIGAGFACNCLIEITIEGGEVTAQGKGAAAGIGGGAEDWLNGGGEGGKVSILGGTVKALSSNVAIGHGGTDKVNGTIQFADDLKVQTGSDGITFGSISSSGSREEDCHKNKNALIEKCDHLENLFDSNEEGHLQSCKSCATSFTREKHSIGDDFICKICGYEAAVAPRFMTHSLVLTGNIAVNFFMLLPEMEGVDYAGSYMEFIVNGDAQRDELDPEDRDLNGHGYYGFTCEVNSIQMAETITARFHYGDGKVVEDTYSVKEYILAYERVKDYFDETTTALVLAMADYGYYAQIALSAQNGWVLGEDYARMDVRYKNQMNYGEVFRAVQGYALDRRQEDLMALSSPVPLNLLSCTELRFIVRYRSSYWEGDVTCTLDGEEVTPTSQPNYRFMVQTGEIPAHLLDEEHEAVFTTSTGTVSVKASPLGYVHEIMAQMPSMADCDAVCALYYYYKATNDFREAHDY